MSDTAAASVVTAHAFTAARWWERCRECALSMAAHLHATPLVLMQREAEMEALDYVCPRCVTAYEFDQLPPHPDGCPRRESA
jgi:hypothetical protein